MRLALILWALSAQTGGDSTSAAHPPPLAVEPQCAPPVHPTRLADFVCPSDYPPEALRHGEQGPVGFHLDVSSQGLVTACQITESSGSVALDRRTCEIMTTRVRFTPKRDANGHPVADELHAWVAWHIR